MSMNASTPGYQSRNLYKDLGLEETPQQFYARQALEDSGEAPRSWWNGESRVPTPTTKAELLASRRSRKMSGGPGAALSLAGLQQALR